MKDDLKRLLNEFVTETKNYRTVKEDMRLTNEMPEKFKRTLREPTLLDLIDWLNNNTEDE